jgi:NADPH2 dehydrogenase
MHLLNETTAASKLFKPLRIGNMNLRHRLVMAPLTRFRADDHHVPLPFTTTYYAQRAYVPGTLLIAEATFISRRAGGFANVPGIWSSEQITAWRKTTDAVHAKGSYIFLQLWAHGHAADPVVARQEGFDIVSSSTIPIDSTTPVPKELTKEEIKSFVNDYANAARCAVEAGFDGVEIHGANGYLVDQFLQDHCNRRSDEYGGSVEKRSRFALEVTRAVIAAIGAERTGIRLSPFSPFQGMKMENPYPQFSHVMTKLKKMNLAYIHLVESRISGNADIDSSDKLDPLIELWGKASPILIAGGFRPTSAMKIVDQDYANQDVAIVFGRYFISTPDLPFRIAHGLDLNPYDRDTFYTPKSPDGYVDYPFSQEFEKANQPGMAATKL